MIQPRKTRIKRMKRVKPTPVQAGQSVAAANMDASITDAIETSVNSDDEEPLSKLRGLLMKKPKAEKSRGSASESHAGQDNYE